MLITIIIIIIITTTNNNNSLFGPALLWSRFCFYAVYLHLSCFRNCLLGFFSK
jgi:hypothetical protein